MKLFSQTPILELIGHRRVPMFLNEFKVELAATGIVLPEPPDPDLRRPSEEQAANYYPKIAELFAAEEKLPERLRKAALVLEHVASDSSRLEGIVLRRLSCISLPRDCPLDCALEVWFAARDELDQFAALNGNGHSQNGQLSHVDEQDRNGNGAAT